MAHKILLSVHKESNSLSCQHKTAILIFGSASYEMGPARVQKWAVLLDLQSFSLHLVIVSEPDVHNDCTDLLRRIHVLPN